MKYIFALIALVGICLCSCKKDAASSPGSTSTTTSTSDSTWLIKTIVTNNSGGSYNYDSFHYDNQHRMTFYLNSVLGSGNYWYYKYNFFYSGNDSLPTSYTFEAIDSAAPTEVYSSMTMTDVLTYNSQVQLTADSTTSSTDSTSTYIKAAQFSYATNLVVARTYYPNDTASNSIDSLYLNSNNCTVTESVNVNNLTGGYYLSDYSTYTYGTVLNPPYNTAASMCLFIVDNFTVAKYEQAQSHDVFYTQSGSPIVFSITYAYVVDSAGLVQSQSGSGSGVTPFVSSFTYY